MLAVDQAVTNCRASATSTIPVLVEHIQPRLRHRPGGLRTMIFLAHQFGQGHLRGASVTEVDHAHGLFLPDAPERRAACWSEYVVAFA